MNPIKAVVRSVLSKLDSTGAEIPDPKPMELPLGFIKPVPLEMMIAQMVKNSDLQRALKSDGVDTFDEAEDFDIPGDNIADELSGSPHEDHLDPDHILVREHEERSGFVAEKADDTIKRKHIIETARGLKKPPAKPSAEKAAGEPEVPGPKGPVIP